MGCLRGGLVLRGHTAAHGHARILATRLLLLLEILVVGHLLLLLVGHVAGVHAGTRHVALGRVDVAVSHILGGLGGDVARVDAVLVVGGVRGVQTGLHEGINIRRPMFFARRNLPGSGSCPRPW